MIRIILFFIFFVGCVSQKGLQRQSDDRELDSSLLAYEKAIIQYNQNDFVGAENTLTKLIKNKPHSIRYKEALYLLGKVYMSQSKSDECLSSFSKVIELSKMSKDSFLGYSLYYSGICYELKNETAKAIAVYQDAFKVQNISDDLKQLEIPARLAVSYSRIGEEKISRDYYAKTKRALNELKKSKYTIKPERRETIAEIVVNMGTLTRLFTSQDDFEDYLSSIRIAQEYLSLVFQLDVESESPRALEMMVSNFNSALEYIENLPVNPTQDQILAKIEDQKNRKKLSILLLSNIEAFEAYLTPEFKSKNKDIGFQLEKMANIKKELEDNINEKNLAQDLTDEAKKLLEPKIPIKIYDEKTNLEKQTKDLPSKKMPE